MFFNALLVVGFLDCMIGSAVVMRVTVRIGVLLITLCCSSLCFAIILCSLLYVAAGLRIALMSVFSVLTNCCLRGVLTASIVSILSLLHSDRKCCVGVKLGSWQCCGYSSVDPEMW